MFERIRVNHFLGKTSAIMARTSWSIDRYGVMGKSLVRIFEETERGQELIDNAYLAWQHNVTPFDFAMICLTALNGPHSFSDAIDGCRLAIEELGAINSWE